MGRIAAWLTATVVVLLLAFGYRTSLSGPRTTGVTGGGAQRPGVVAGPAPAASGSVAPTVKAQSGDVVVNGDVAQTMWGPVQVQVHITGSRIVDVVTLIRPSGTGRDEAINSYALPILRQETLAAQSARIQAVSGATVTSGGYVESLQAALAAAHFGG